MHTRSMIAHGGPAETWAQKPTVLPNKAYGNSYQFDIKGIILYIPTFETPPYTLLGDMQKPPKFAIKPMIFLTPTVFVPV